MTELSNLCGLAQAQAVKKNRGAASCVLEAGWHLVTFAFVLRGRRRMPLRWLWWRAWAGLVTSDAAALLRGRRASFCVAGVELGDICLRFTWQAWHRRSVWRHPPSFHVTGVAFGDIHLQSCVAGMALRALGWLWWRAWTGLVAGDTAALCVAGVALDDIRLVSRGRCGIW